MWGDMLMLKISQMKKKTVSKDAKLEKEVESEIEREKERERERASEGERERKAMNFCCTFSTVICHGKAALVTAWFTSALVGLHPRSAQIEVYHHISVYGVT